MKDDVLELYSKYGEVKDVFLPTDRQTGEFRGFAFVTMDKEAAEKAIEETSGMEFLGRRLAVSLPLPPGERGARVARARECNNRSASWLLYTIACTVSYFLSLFVYSPEKALRWKSFFLHFT